jgi:hypothetical protein
MIQELVAPVNSHGGSAQVLRGIYALDGPQPQADGTQLGSVQACSGTSAFLDTLTLPATAIYAGAAEPYRTQARDGANGTETDTDTLAR